MKVTFLGTGTSTGIPLIGSDHPVCQSSNEKDKRLRSSVLIQWDNYSYIIDTGPDFRQQMLRSKCNRIDGVLYTQPSDLPYHPHNQPQDAVRREKAYGGEYKSFCIPVQDPMMSGTGLRQSPWEHLSELRCYGVQLLQSTFSIFLGVVGYTHYSLLAPS